MHKVRNHGMKYQVQFMTTNFSMLDITDSDNHDITDSDNHDITDSDNHDITDSDNHDITTMRTRPWRLLQAQIEDNVKMHISEKNVECILIKASE
jgi:hypothetical protein